MPHSFAFHDLISHFWCRNSSAVSAADRTSCARAVCHFRLSGTQPVLEFCGGRLIQAVSFRREGQMGLQSLG